MTQEEVCNYFKKNYPEVDLYETEKGSFFGGYDGMDQLEIFGTNLVVFCVEKVKGKYVPKQKYFSFVNSTEEELKEFLEKYL